MRLYVHAQIWDKHSLSFWATEGMDYGVPIGTLEIKLPDGLIPSDLAFGHMVREYELKQARLVVARKVKELGEAEEVVKNLLALPVGSALADPFDDDVPF